MSWEIVLIIFLVIIIFIVILLPLVLELRTTLKKISNLVDNVNKDLPEILQNIKTISDHTTIASEKLHNAVGDIVEFEQKISKQIKQPVLEATASIAAIIHGLQSLLNYFLQKRKKK